MSPEDAASPARGSYADDSPLVRLLRKEGRVRILDVFLRKHYTPLSAPEVADLAGVSVSTFTRNKDELLALNIVEEVEREGNAQHYQLNKDSEIAQILGEAQRELLELSQQIVEETDVNDEPVVFKGDFSETTEEDSKRSRDLAYRMTPGDATV